MIEIDAIIFTLAVQDSQSLGFNFLKLIDMNFNYFASDHLRNGMGFAAPNVIGLVSHAYQWGWIFNAAASYSVNIANASNDRVSVLARPHLTALNGTPATFLAGGEIVYQVSGLNTGDIKPYPFGTTLTVTPTLLRTPAEDGTPRVHMVVEAGRTSLLRLIDRLPNQPDQFQKVTVTSEAALSLGQTLILSGLSQREATTSRSGVPVLMDIPILKYLFSTWTTVTIDSAVIILLTPRDPAFWDERNRRALAEFVEMRRAFLQARQGTQEDMQRFRERYPDWDQIPANRFASHYFLVKNSELYRAVSGENLTSEDLNLDLELLGPKK
jgi:type II secretory pathway component GspD/PulD (secretin)